MRPAFFDSFRGVLDGVRVKLWAIKGSEILIESSALTR